MDNYRFSRFEVAKPVIRIKESQLITDEFNLLALESIQGKNFFFQNVDKYLDFSFYNRNLLNHEANETVFRFGLGKSIHFKNLAISALPYVGVRHFQFKNESQIATDQGLRLISQFVPIDEITTRFVITRYFFSPFEFNFIYELEASYRLTKYFSTFSKIESTSLKKNKNSFAEIGIAYLF
jgi:hypothetical protein